jgi:hypothetical protein
VETMFRSHENSLSAREKRPVLRPGLIWLLVGIIITVAVYGKRALLACQSPQAFAQT